MMTTLRATSSFRRGGAPIPLIVLIAIFAVLLLAGLTWWSRSSAAPQAAGMFYRVSEMPLEVTVSKDAELQAVENIDVVSPVEGNNTIQWIIKEGTSVKKGDVICIIDSTELETKLQTALLDLQRAQAELTSAREQREIQLSNNAANLETARAELTIAELDLQQYLEGTYPQTLAEYKRGVEMAEINAKTKEQELAQKQSLFGKGFVNASEVKKAQIDLLAAQNDLEKQQTELRVLQEYTHKKDLTEKKNTLQQAQKKLERVERENASNLAEKEADLQAEERTVMLRQEVYDKTKSQLDACTIRAPGAGLVVYVQERRREQPLQAGAQVRYQEQILRLPDTSSMKAVARINENQVTKLYVDPGNPLRALVRIVGQPEPVAGWVSNISVMADSSNRWWNPDSREYPVDITLGHTPQGLKPGMSAEVRIFVDRVDSAVAVPLASIYTSGKDSYVFARSGPEVKPVKVTLGMVNQTHAAINQGLDAGAQVLLLEPGQGRTLLEENGIALAPEPADPGATLAEIEPQPEPIQPVENPTTAPAIEPQVSLPTTAPVTALTD